MIAASYQGIQGRKITISLRESSNDYLQKSRKCTLTNGEGGYPEVTYLEKSDSILQWVDGKL